MSASNCGSLVKYDPDIECQRGANLRVLRYWASKTSVLLDSATVWAGCQWSGRCTGWGGRRGEIPQVVLSAAQDGVASHQGGPSLAGEGLEALAMEQPAQGQS